jgi:hypothetical protein
MVSIFNNLDFLKGALGGYSSIQTEDGHSTLYSEYFDENCHSLAGAYEETLYNYVEGLSVPEKFQEGELYILEVGLGPALGPKVTFERLKDLTGGPLTFISTEIDIELAKNVLIKSELRNSPLPHLYLEKDQFRLIILLGDARISVEKAFKASLFPSVDIIYQDAFSPKKNPLLWTKEWFTCLKNISHSHTLMGTYCSDKAARKSMMEAGWNVSGRPGFGKKRFSTQATLNGSQDIQVLEECLRSPKNAYYDQDFGVKYD